MYNSSRLSLFVASLCCFINISCKKAEKAQEQNDVYYQELNTSLNFNQTGPLGIDLNQDGTPDLQIYKDQYETTIDGLKGFFIKSLGEHKTIQIKLTDNPLFDCMNLMSYTSGSVISGSLDEEYTWSSKNGLLAMRTEPQTSFIGRWSDGSAKTMAVRLSLQGKLHYGWLKLQYSRENNSITLISYAYQKTPEKAIQIQ